MNEYPAFVHAWTQSDRLAIAMNFQNNGFDLFHPATYNLLTKDGITQVDFPIHDYLVALFSWVFKTDIISTFRFYNLTYALIGLFYLYRAALLWTNSTRKSAVLTFFIASLPFFVYYQNGFLASVPSFANFCIALYFFLSFEKKKKSAHFYWAVLWISIAALARIPFTVFLIAFTATELIRQYQSKQRNLIHIVACIAGLASVAAYYFYNQSLAEEYGSMFLVSFRQADSFLGFIEIVISMIKNWGSEILSPYHSLFLILLVVVFYTQKNKLKQNKTAFSPFTLFLAFSSLGVLCYFILMAKQFVEHDYYLIDSFLPALCLVLIWILGKVQLKSSQYTIAFSLSIILLIGFYVSANETMSRRYSADSNSRVNYNYRVFSNAKADIEQWGVDKADTLAFLDIGSSNIPFTLFDRKGYATQNSGEDSVKTVLRKNFTYAFLVDSFKISDSYFDYPSIANQLKLMRSNGELSMYTKNNSEDPSQYFEQLHYCYFNSFENNVEDSLMIVNASFQREENNTVLEIKEEDEYVLTASIVLDDQYDTGDLRIGVKADLRKRSESLKGFQYIISVGDYYFAFYLESEVQNPEDWSTVRLMRKIPAEYLTKGAELKCYFWNQEKRNIQIDNYHLIVYQ